MTNLEYALKYAEMGWSVFPSHTIIKGICSCKRADCNSPAKHPIASLVPRGHNDASKDAETIKKWWKVHPEANIGIATGKQSGIIVIDIDDPNAIPQDSLPDTIEQITGSGGRHVIYKRPNDGYKYQTDTSTGGILGVDSRADGGYIIAAPSLHKSGRHYEWEGSSSPFDGVAIMDAPEWWLALIRVREIEVGIAHIPEWNVSDDLPDDIGDILNHIPSHEYRIWRDVGLALHHAAPNSGFDWWNWWSSKAENYNFDAVKREWENFSRRKHAVAKIFTLDGIRRLADLNGYVDPRIGQGEAIIASLEAGQQERIAERVRSSSSELEEVDRPQIVPKRGLMRDIVDHIVRTSIWPQPDLAAANTIAFMGALAGRRYCTEYGGFSNIYTVGICDSGGGKDHSRKIINKLAVLAGAGDYIGGENFASGQAIIKALERNPSQLFQLDEFGKFVSAATDGKASDYKRDIITKLMILYSSAGGIYQGTEYADSKTNPRIIITNPCACVYGTTTPDSFWSGMSSGESIDGFLSRLLIIESDTYREIRQKPDMSEVKKDILDRIREVATFKGAGIGNLDAEPLVISMSVSVLDDIDRLEVHLTERMTGSAERSIYSRVVEQAIKLAMLYAISVDEKVIGDEAWLWGRELSLWSANQLANKVKDVIADTGFEGACKQVVQAIKGAGTEGVSARELARSCSKFRGMQARAREDLLKVVSDDYGIVSELVKPEGAGRPTKKYFIG